MILRKKYNISVRFQKTPKKYIRVGFENISWGKLSLSISSMLIDDYTSRKKRNTYHISNMVKLAIKGKLFLCLFYTSDTT